MAEATDIGKCLQLTCYIYQGVATRRDVTRNDGKIEKGVTYSAEISVGDVVQIWTDSQAGEKPIVAADRNDTIDPTESGFSGAIGIVITQPSGKVPDISSNGGTYTESQKSHMREATVEFPGFSIVRAFVITDASKAGAFVGWDQSETQMTTNSGTVAYRPYLLIESSSAAGTHSVMM